MKTIIVDCGKAHVLACAMIFFAAVAQAQSTNGTNGGTFPNLPVVGPSNFTRTSNATNPSLLAPPSQPTLMTPVGANATNAARVAVSVINDPNEMVLKYEQFLRQETKEQRELFETYYKRTIGLVSLIIFVVGTIAAIFGYKNFNGLKAQILKGVEKDVRTATGSALQNLEQDMRKESNNALSERKKWMDNQHRSDRLKVHNEFKSVFGSLFEVNPDIRDQRFTGAINASALRGKTILWVDDDPVGIACQVAILESLGTRIDLSSTTEEALKNIGGEAYDLVISNMNRFPDESAGVDLTKRIRATSNVKILIFTVEKRLKSHGKQATDAGANALESETNRLLDTIYNLIVEPKIITV